MVLKLPEMLICEHCGNYYFNEISVYVKGNNSYDQLITYMKCEVCKTIYNDKGEEVNLFNDKD